METYYGTYSSRKLSSIIKTTANPWTTPNTKPESKEPRQQLYSQKPGFSPHAPAMLVFII